MPKIRGIKPDFWTDDVVVELSPLARLLFMGLWTYACDNGHVEDKPRQIKMRILPADRCKVSDLLTELETAERISRKDGWVLIPNFVKHQKVDKRFFVTCSRPDCHKPGEEPENTTSQPESRRAHVVPTTSTPRAHVVVSTRPPGDVDGDVDGEVMVKGANKRRATAIPANWQPTTEHRDRALAAGLTLGREADKFRQHAAEKDRKAANWNAAFTRWLMNAEEYSTRGKPPVRSLPTPAQLESPPDGLSPEEYAEWERGVRARRAQ